MKAAKPKPAPGYEALASYSIGPKLKALRTEKGLTLSRLGAEIGLSTALLSKLESEIMVPTLPTLAKISRAFGVDLSYFFSPVSHHSSAITRRAHISNPRRDLPNVKHTPLHWPTPESRQSSEVIEIPSGATFNVGGIALRTELTAYVLEGPVSMTVAGVVDVLETGDCVVLDTDAAVTLTGMGNLSRVLAVFARARLSPDNVDSNEPAE